MSLNNILTGNHILMMPMGSGGPGGGGAGDGGGSGEQNTQNTRTGRDAEDSVTEAQKEAKFAEDIVKAKIMTNEQLLRQKQIMEEINKKMGDAYKAQKEQMAQQQINISNLSSDYQKLIEAGTDSDAAMTAMRAKYSDFIGANAALYEEITKIATNAGTDMEKFSLDIEGLKGELDTAKSAGEAFDEGMKSIVKSFGFAGSASETFSGKLIMNGLKLKGLSYDAAKKEAWTSFKNSIVQATNPLMLFGSIIDKVVKSAIEFDNASKKLQATLGDEKVLLMANAGELRRMGMTASDQGRIVEELITGFKGLGRNADFNVNILKDTTATLQALGVEASDTTKILTRMSIGLQAGEGEILALTTRLAANAKAFGMTRKKIVSEFASMTDSLISYGDRMEDVFIGLAEQSKRTGISITNLKSLAESFDKFSDSAQKAGQLNALFGTSLSAMGLNAMTLDQRIESLTQQLGPQLKSMTRYQKLALKNVLGTNSVAEAVQLLGGKLTAGEKKQMKAIELQKDMTQTLQELAKSTLPLAKQFQVMFEELTSNPNAIKGIIRLMEALSYVAIAIGNNFQFAIPIIFAMTTALYVLALGIASVKVAMGGALAVFVLMGFAMYSLSDAMHHERSPKFYLMFGVIAAGIIGLGLAAIFVQPGLLTLAAVFLGVGLTMSAIFYGMNMVVESLTGLFTVLSEGGENFPKAAGGLHLMASGMLALGYASLIATSAILGAMAGMSVIQDLIGFSAATTISVAGEGMNKLGIGIEKFAAGLGKIKVIASELKNSIGDSLIAASMEGEKMSVLVGKEAAVTTLFKNDTLKIKVDMPAINIPTPKFDIYLDGQLIDAKIEQRYNK